MQSLLFVRAGSDAVIAPLDWVTCFEKYGFVINPPHPVEQSECISANNLAVSSPVETIETSLELPTQVVLVEWLQFLRGAFTAVVGGAFRPRVGVIVSAWDAAPIEQQPKGPAPYIRENFPMLYQFIEANDNQFDFQMFGLSIVGGDLTNDEQFKRTYLARPRESGFVYHSILGKLEKSADVTLPVAWALGLLPA